MRIIKSNILLLNIIICFFEIHFLSAQEQIVFKLETPTAPQSVHVVGDFNDWSKTANPLSDKNGDSVWETTIQLEPGQYEYRFLIDGLIRIKDPENPFWAGEKSNSILWVKSNQTPQVVNIKPETGSIVRSSNVFITAQYRDGLGNFGLDLKSTQVLLNGQRQKFAFNKKLNRIEILPGKLKDGEYFVEINALDNDGNEAQKVSSYFLVNENNVAPIADAGYTIISGINTKVVLNSGVSYDPDRETIEHFKWRLIQKPGASKAKLNNRNSPFPYFIPDKVGRYLFTLQISDGKAKSKVDSVDVYAFIDRDYLVEFQLSDSVFNKIYETSIDSVSVAGEFNNWNFLNHPMNDYNHDGIWSAWIKIDPGEYEYKFVVNGNHWIADPTNPNKTDDSWNGFNSIISASLNLTPEIKVKSFLGPGKVIFDASASYSKIGSYLTYLWFQDINNPQRFMLNSDKKIFIPTPREDGTYYFYLVVKDQTGNSARKTFVLNVNHGKVKLRDFSNSPEWAKDAIIYEVDVSEFSTQGNLKGLTEKIPYLKSLGINCISLISIFEGTTANGRGINNFFGIKEDYGNLDDFQFFVKKAHDAGIRTVLDFVASHSSDQHSYFISAFRNPLSVFRHWYRWHNPEENRGYCAYEFQKEGDNFPSLNYENPNVRQYILGVAKFWSNLGIDGFRCINTSTIPHGFWKLFRRTLKNSNPDFLIIDAADLRSMAFHKDEFDMSYDTDFYSNLIDVMEHKKKLSTINYEFVKTRKNYPASALALRYIENYDKERFTGKYGINRAKLAASLLLTISGAPLICYGQEIGLTEQLETMNWLTQNDDLFDFYKKLILLRRHHICFRRGEKIDIYNNFSNQVLSYIRQTEKEIFLVILNFGEELNSCQFLLPNTIIKRAANLKLELKNVLSAEKIYTRIYQNQQIKLQLKKETSYILKIVTN